MKAMSPWKSEKGTYPVAWREISLLIKETVFFRCENCGSRSVPGRYLTVHHLDMEKSNCLWFNLVAFCQVCHLCIQANYIPGQMWIFEPPAWAIKRDL